MRSKALRVILVGPVFESARALKQELERLRLREGDRIIGVDGGVSLIRRLQVKPDLAIGDWDSIRRKSDLKGLRTVTLPRRKDRSDLYYALELALDGQATELVCLGVTGGRTDHQIAALDDISAAVGRRKSKVTLAHALGSDAEFYFLAHRANRVSLSLKRKQVFSVFGLKGGADGVSIRGARYSLTRAKLTPSSFGLSNEAQAKAVTISIRSGYALVVVPRGDAR